MKRIVLLLGLISLFCGYSAQGQIYTKYEQGFELTGESYSYTVTSGTATPVTTVASSGSRSLKMQHGSTETIVQLDTVDFTDFAYTSFYLEFMHICDVDPLTTANPDEIATIEYRQPGTETWTVMAGGADYYDVAWGGGSEEFVANNNFNNHSYGAWQGTTINNSWWKRERFKLDNILTNSTLSSRKLIIRFRLHPRTASGSTNAGWYLDKITVRCSQSSMALPLSNMITYPEAMNYPNSRDTRITAEFTTTAMAGMCADSIYVVYQLGSSAPIRRHNMSLVPGTNNRYQYYIPFCGYDTVVKWRVVAKDATTNHNTVTYPLDEEAWEEYRSVRGTENNSNFVNVTQGTTNLFPFCHDGDGKFQFFYDSVELAEAGFGPGAITQIRYSAASSVVNSTRQRFAVSMRNVPSDYTFPSDNRFNTDYHKTVFDNPLTITQNNNTVGVIDLQDTFFYAGQHMIVTMIADCTTDPTALSVKTISNASPSGLQTLYSAYSSSMGQDPFNTGSGSSYRYGTVSTARPNFYFRASRNVPLIYDCGISGFVTPNDSTTGNAVGNNDVIVTLKNYGASPINAVRIYYSVDNGPAQYYDWTGNLAADATTNVTINTTQTYSAGYHEMLAWVDDSVTVNGALYRDHEPLNDTLWTRFVACDGPMSGVRTVGGSTPDYATLSKFLYAASLCGVNGPLTVKLAPGTYQPELFPNIPGTSSTNYVLFEPLGSPTSVTFQANHGESTAVSPYLVNLQAANHIRFHNINFVSSAMTVDAATYQVRLGTNSTGCQFINCHFTENQGNTSEAYMVASALLYSGGCDSLLVDSCSFSRGTAAISLVGPALDNKAHGSIIRNSTFQHQGVNGVIVRNQVDVVVDSNVFNDVYANSSYVILLQDCDGASQITRNTVYVTSGASCIGATDFAGTAGGYAVIANNMLVSADAGTSNMLTTPLNIITANYTKVLHNAIKMSAPTRSGIAAATFGGGVLQNSWFFNNIVSCFDTVNFALNYIPTSGATNYIGYNIYYAKGPILNKYDGINCATLAAWQGHCTMDALSQAVDPAFLNSTSTDLRSYSQYVKGHGIHIDEVDIDIFGTERDTVTPCVGAFEFSSLPYDFEIIEFLEPYDEYCDAPTNAPLRVVIKNSGVNTFDPSTATTAVQLTYSRTNTPGSMSPGFSGTVQINRTIPGNDTIVYNTGITMPFATNGLRDSTYHLYMWLTSTIDPNPANDTNFTTVVSHYHSPAPDSINLTINYGTVANITATGGLQTWYANVFNSGASRQSEVYWYTSPTSENPVWRGKNYTTGLLYADTTLYIRQKRDYPLVRITEVQIKNNLPGVTYPMPLWMNGNTNFAIELTNVGDYPADLTDDTIQIVSAVNSLNNKFYKFPNIVLQPGQNIVLQYRAGINNVDSTVTLGTATLSPNLGQAFAVLYKDDGVFVDAVAFNDVNTQAVWTGLNIPSTVWAGAGIDMPDSILTAGFYRSGWPSSAANSRQYWQMADATHLMTLGTTNQGLVRYRDNGCPGDMAPVHIHLINLPAVDMVVDSLNLNSGCGLGVDSLTVTIRNRGSQASGTVVAHYQVVSHPLFAGQSIPLQTCTDTLSSMSSASVLHHTFSAPIDYTVQSGSTTFDVMVWVDKIEVDNTNFNDTSRAELVSMFTPGTPNVYGYDTINYGERAVLQPFAATGDSLAWYDSQMMPLDTVNVFISDYLYSDDTFYVTAFGTRENLIHIGTLASTSTATGYPSPYNPNKKYVREQYIYTVDDLVEAGHSAGPINSVSFYLDTILAPSGSITYTDFSVGIAATTNDIFTGASNWQTVDTLYHADTLVVTNGDKGWVKHVFDTPFQWDGTSNIVVQVVHTVDPNLTQGARTRYTGGYANKVLFKNDNSNITALLGNGTRNGNRPDIRFGFVDLGCEGPAQPVYVNIVNIPDADAALAWPAGSDTLTYTSCGNTDINVRLRNMGGQQFNSYTIDYWLDATHGVFTGSHAVSPRGDSVLTVTQHTFTPGRHTLRAVVTIAGDTVHTNDTITRVINVRFCGGTYTIGSSGMYPNFTTAIDTLNHAGIAGPVVFSVQNGTYTEQVSIGSVIGSSMTNTLTFRGATGDSTDVVLRYAPVATANYVLMLDGASYMNFEDMTIYANGGPTYSNAVSIANSNNIRFENDLVRVKGTLNNANASCFTVGEGVYFFYIDSTTVDSGYYSLVTTLSTPGASEGFYFNNSKFINFQSQGLRIRKVNEVYVVHNEVISGVDINNRALTGIFIAEHNGPVTVERNNVVLNDNRTGGKQGIRLVSINGSNATRSHVYNNMTAIYGTGTSGLVSTGISIDSSSWVNVYFNTCQVFAGTGGQSQTSRAFGVGSSSGIYVMNNVFSNISRGYAYYVQQAANIGNSNYNNYWSNSDGETPRLAYWGGTECGTFNELRTADNMDENSMNEQTYFVSETDLHFRIGNLCEHAQYNTEVPLDIDGELRPQIPSPTMGADEFFRCIHNIAIMDILEPVLDITDNVESDTLRVVVKLTNDGTSTESNLVWWAEIESDPTLHSVNRPIDEILPQAVIYDTTFIVMPIGVIDTQRVVIHFPLATGCEQSNCIQYMSFFLDPAYNFRADEVTVESGDGCRLQHTQVSVTLTNVGRKSFPAGDAISIGFNAVLQTAGVTVSTLPAQWAESTTLPMSVEPNASVTLNFVQTANLYPTGIAKDITVRTRAWATHRYDQKPLNDTCSFTSVSSKFTPSAPVGIDLHIPYATWDTIFASQTDVPPGAAAIHRPIMWYRDSTDDPYHAPTNYAASCWWETPQYFHDSTYFLACVSAAGCTSYYSAVHVNLNARVPVDMAVKEVVEPQPVEVYMIDDSVKVNLINYGSQAVSNIPVVFQLFDLSGNLIQQSREVCHATIQPDQEYVFRFDSLIHIPTWSSTAKYSMRTWTDMNNENVRLNDTIRLRWRFNAAADDVYPMTEVNNKGGLDITRVAFSSLDNEVSPVGHDYINFVNATRTSPALSSPQQLIDGLQDFGGKVSMQNVGDLRVLHLMKGTTDTMVIACANSDNSSDKLTSGYVSVYIDQDRDGYFYVDPLQIDDSTWNYDYPYSELVCYDSIKSLGSARIPLTIPTTMRTGYTRMRVILGQGATSPSAADASIQFGSVQDFLVFIEDSPVEIDLCAARIESPYDPMIGGNTGVGGDIPVAVTFMMANKGATPITSADILYIFNNDSNYVEETIQWSGYLEPGHSVEVALPEYEFYEGRTDLMIVVSAPGDTITFNDTLLHEYFRAPVQRLIFNDDFEGPDYWFMPHGYTAFSQNLWQKGYPNKMNILSCVSDSNVWATNINGYISVSETGNRSIMYTPIFDISQVRPDTINLWIAADMAEGHLLSVEYCDYLDRWVSVGSGNDSLWFNTMEGWTGTTSGYGYVNYLFPTSRISGEFQQRVQFRIVYKALTESDACDGAAVDNFMIGRARRNVDVGVIAITYPEHPRFGQVINPTVIIKNFGLDTMYSIGMGYEPYGSYLPKLGRYNNPNGLSPGETDVFTFDNPFTVYSDFPDTFQIKAYTKENMDIYFENDAVTQEFYLSPLDHDVAVVDFIYPLDRVIAGDSVNVTTRIRNYGQLPIEEVTVSYIYNSSYSVTETINFRDLTGEPLGSFEYFNYTFHQKFRASMGLMNIKAIVHMDNDDYPFNDTIAKSINGLSAITDLRATEVIVDSSSQAGVFLQVTVDNVGARAANDFEVAVWYYNDTNTIMREFYHSEQPLPALATLYYRFPDTLPHHDEYYNYVTAFVHAEEDNDRSNDTTSIIGERHVDWRTNLVEVEENREDSCRVRIQVENVGNATSTRNINLSATVNGQSFTRRITMPECPPGRTFTYEFDTKLPKSPTRTYEGIGSISNSDDNNNSNDQTSRVEVRNYFEDVPVVTAPNGVELHQNYPNPFENTTRIDFYLPNSAEVSFFVMDEMGRLVYQKIDNFSNGDHSINFTNKNLPSGVYFYGIEVDGERLMRRMVLKR